MTSAQKFITDHGDTFDEGTMPISSADIDQAHAYGVELSDLGSGPVLPADATMTPPDAEGNFQIKFSDGSVAECIFQD